MVEAVRKDILSGIQTVGEVESAFPAGTMVWRDKSQRYFATSQGTAFQFSKPRARENEGIQLSVGKVIRINPPENLGDHRFWSVDGVVRMSEEEIEKYKSLFNLPSSENLEITFDTDTYGE